MDQNNDTNGRTGGSNFAGATGTTGTTGTTGSPGMPSNASGANYTGGSQTADTFRPTGDTVHAQPATTHHAEADSFNEARSTYQPPVAHDVTVTQRRTASRPSRNLVIGSAVAGAVAGGVIPFMLSGRKSTESKSVEVDAGRSNPSVHADKPAQAGRSSEPRRR